MRLVCTDCGNPAVHKLNGRVPLCRKHLKTRLEPNKYGCQICRSRVSTQRLTITRDLLGGIWYKYIKVCDLCAETTLSQ